ncbi:MAG: hypothetical protein M3076_07925 [Actinomycetota bacterium]|nr:hypothetical protein [Actinomycetota bacterium]
MKRLFLLASGLLTLAAFPATGAAATRAEGIIYSGSVQVRAYKMQLLAVTQGKNHGDLVAISFSRGTSADKQEHYYQFTKHVQVHLAPGGASGTIKANLGTYGKIDLTFSAGGGRITPGCPGSFLSQHAGTLKGTFHFVSGSSYFKTINNGSLRAFSATSKKAPSCKPPTKNATHGTSLDVDSIGSPGRGSFKDFNIQRDPKGRVIEQFLILDSSQAKKGVVIARAIDVAKLPASAFTNAADLSSANAVASGQFMSGSVAFTSSTTVGNTASGTVSGSITAKFDGLGSVTVPQGTTFSALSTS